MSTKLIYKEKEYDSYLELAEEYNVSKRFLIHQLNKGLSVDTAMELSLSDAENYVGHLVHWKPLLYKGNVVSNLGALAKRENIDYDLLVDTLDEGYDIANAVKKIKLEKDYFYLDGMYYKTITDFAKVLGVRVPSVKKALKLLGGANSSKELKRLSLRIDKDRDKELRKYKYDNKIFDNIEDVISYYNIQPLKFRNKAKTSRLTKMLESSDYKDSFIFFDNRFFKDSKRLNKYKKIINYFGEFIVYPSSVKEEILHSPIKKEYLFLDKTIYNNMSSLTRTLDIQVDTLRELLNIGLSLKTSVDIIKNKAEKDFFLSLGKCQDSDIVVRGNVYKNLKTFSSSFDFDYNSVVESIKMGVSLGLMLDVFDVYGEYLNSEEKPLYFGHEVEINVLPAISNYDMVRVDGSAFVRTNTMFDKLDLDANIGRYLLEYGYSLDEIVNALRSPFGVKLGVDKKYLDVDEYLSIKN